MAFSAREYLELFGFTNFKAQGSNLMASCFDPLGMHPRGDKKRSFGIHIHTGLANCYVCGGWNIEQLTALLLTHHARAQGKGYLFNEYDAWKWLEEKDWIPEYTVDDFLDQVKRLEDRKEFTVYSDSVLEPYLKRVHKSLLSPQEPNNRYYSLDIIRKFKIGYCEDSKRIIFPTWDSFGRLRGVISRAVSEDEYIRYGVGTPNKEIYLSEKRFEMELTFEKGRVLYGENFFQGHDTLFIIESPADVAWAHMAGLNDDMDIGAIFGASLTQEQERVARNYRNVILGFDNDDAGQRGKEAAIKRLMGITRVYTFDNYGHKDLGQCTLEETQMLPIRLKQETFSVFASMKPME